MVASIIPTNVEGEGSSGTKYVIAGPVIQKAHFDKDLGYVVVKSRLRINPQGDGVTYYEDVTRKFEIDEEFNITMVQNDVTISCD